MREIFAPAERFSLWVDGLESYPKRSGVDLEYLKSPMVGVATEWS
jgi:hypothetical protein